ncbi:MAG: flagellar basal body P-ring formation chaperone FlgA [Oricola sp.]
MKRWLHIAGILVSAICLWVSAARATESGDFVITVNRVIYPGQVVTADAIVETPLFSPLAPGMEVIRDAEMMIGKVAAKTILPRRLIAPNALRDAYAVEAGEVTTVYYRAGALTIAMDAVALQSAGFGKTVRVRNTDSGRTITGIVQPDGTVAVEAR